MPVLSSRTKTFTDSVIRRMNRVSLKYDAINLSQGFPDWEPPLALRHRLVEVAAAAASVFHYLGRRKFPSGAGPKTGTLYGP